MIFFQLNNVTPHFFRTIRRKVSSFIASSNNLIMFIRSDWSGDFIHDLSGDMVINKGDADCSVNGSINPQVLAAGSA